MKKQIWLAIEFLLLFCCLPVLLYFIRMEISHKVIWIIWLVASGCLFVLIRDKKFNIRTLSKRAHLAKHAREILLTFIFPAVVMAILTHHCIPDRFLSFPMERPMAWAGMLILYPLLAAYPQEIIFRGYFFHRYQPLFPNQISMITVSSVCFGLAHLFYANWVAPLLSTAGGLLFAYRYLKSESILLAGMEHGLWGNFLFTVGIGWYFYSGVIQ